MIKVVASILLLAASAFAGTPYAYNSVLPGGSVTFTSGVVAAAPAYAAAPLRAFAPAPAVRAFAPAPVAYAARAPVGYAAPAPVAYAAPAPVAYAAPAVVKTIAPEPFDPNPQYNYAYSVSDALTGDQKSATETRNGDAVSGQYSLVEPDGAIRTVTYTADSINGFNAVVDRQRAAVAVAKVAAPVVAARAPFATYAAPGYAHAAPAYAHAAPAYSGYRAF